MPLPCTRCRRVASTQAAPPTHTTPTQAPYIVFSVAAAGLCGVLLTHGYKSADGARHPTYKAAISTAVGPRTASLVSGTLYLTFLFVTIA